MERKRVTPRDVLRAWREGALPTEMAVRFRLSAADVEAALRNMGVPLAPPEPRRALPDADVLRAHREAGETLAEIGARYGFSPSSISQRLRAA